MTGGIVALIGRPFPFVGAYWCTGHTPASGTIPVVVFSDLDSVAIRFPQVIILQDSGGDDHGGRLTICLGPLLTIPLSKTTHPGLEPRFYSLTLVRGIVTLRSSSAVEVGGT